MFSFTHTGSDFTWAREKGKNLPPALGSQQLYQADWRLEAVVGYVLSVDSVSDETSPPEREFRFSLQTTERNQHHQQMIQLNLNWMPKTR